MASGMKRRLRDTMMKMTLLTSPLQARNEENLMIDIPGMYLVIFQSSQEDEETFLSAMATLLLLNGLRAAQ